MTKTRVGWIGAGVIGGSCAARLLDAQYPLVVSTQTRAKAEPLLQKGAQWADSPADVAKRSDVVFSCVGYPRDVREVFFGERGVLAGWADVPLNERCDKIYVDMTTSAPTWRRKFIAPRAIMASRRLTRLSPAATSALETEPSPL